VGTAGGATFGSPTFDEIAMAFASTMAPGWVRTELGGPDAPLGIEERVPSLVNVLVSKLGAPGLHDLDRLGRPLSQTSCPVRWPAEGQRSHRRWGRLRQRDE
jgi:hypothetical protein